MEQETIQVVGFEKCDAANGPGLRTTVYLSGCDKHCPHCFNPETWPHTAGSAYTVEELKSLLADDLKVTKKITWLGGEPLLQWKKILPLVEEYSKAGYNQFLYTGYTKDQVEGMMKQDSEFERFISYMNYIKVGPYIHEKYDVNLSFRGSSNQRIYRTHILVDMDKSKDNVCLLDITDEWDAHEFHNYRAAAQLEPTEFTEDGAIMQPDGRHLRGKIVDITKQALLGYGLTAKPPKFELPDMPKHPRNISDNK